MKVLIVSSNTLPGAPTGPVYVAGAVRQAGHEVDITMLLQHIQQKQDPA